MPDVIASQGKRHDMIQLWCTRMYRPAPCPGYLATAQLTPPAIPLEHHEWVNPIRPRSLLLCPSASLGSSARRALELVATRPRAEGCAVCLLRYECLTASNTYCRRLLWMIVIPRPLAPRGTVLMMFGTAELARLEHLMTLWAPPHTDAARVGGPKVSRAVLAL